MGYGYKRLELHEDNRIYIRDSDSEVLPGTTDAVEFSPAMIIDGETVVNARSGFSDLQPRACLGQSKYGEIIALLVEGRLTTSVGISVPDCAAIMAKHDCMQAMNLDGGTSAMIWYKGKYIMRSSNPALTAGARCRTPLSMPENRPSATSLTASQGRLFALYKSFFAASMQICENGACNPTREVVE